MSTSIEKHRTVGELVTEMPSRSRVFENLGIDYCCGGKLPLEEACTKNNLDANTVVTMLKAFENSEQHNHESDNPADMTLSELCDHIVLKHHQYLRDELPRLSAMTEKVAAVHGKKWEWTVALRDTFRGLREELTQHMMKEEQILFPAICAMEAGETPTTVSEGNIKDPVTMMEEEHDNAGDALARMNSLSNGYQPPAEACNTFRAMLDALETLESDMHQHIHKENNILFPRAIKKYAA